MLTRTAEFDIAKGFAIYLVVFGHLISHFTGTGLEGVSLAISFCHMPVFFFISGYFLSSSIKKYSPGELWRKKTRSLLLVYLIWSAISFCANIAVFMLHGASESGAVFSEFLDIFVYSRSVWFLVQLYFSTVVFIISAALSEKYRMNRYAVMLSAWLILSVILPNEILCFYKFKWLFPFLMLGSWTAGSEKARLCIQKYRKAGLLAVPLYIACVIAAAKLLDSNVYFSFTYHSLHDFFTGILCYLISGLSIAGIFAAACLKLPEQLRSYLCRTGSSSLDIYVIHMFFIKLLPQKAVFLLIPPLQAALIAVCSAAIIAVIVFLKEKLLSRFKPYELMLGRG